MQPKQLGPVGGEGGRPFDGYIIPADARLTAVHIFAEWVLDALRFEYAGSDGTPGGNPPIGGLGGYHHVFYLDEDEYLLGISGRCGWYVDSLRLHTNKRVSDLYGGEGGEREYALMAPAGHEIVGLFGHCDWYIDSLGVLLRPVALREEATEGAALEAEAAAERTAEEAEEALDHALDGVAAEMATEGGDVLAASIAHRSEAWPWLHSDPEAVAGDIPSPEDTDTLDEASLEALVAALEEELDAEQRDSETEEALDLASAGRLADFPAVEASLMEWTGEEGELLDAIVVVRRADVESEAEVETLEEAAIAEAIAVLQEGRGDEGAVDVAVYTQVDESDEGNAATVLAVARPAAGEAGDDESETAVMVVDAIESEDELAELEEEAVEEALLALEEDLGQSIDDADVTIYMGTTEDETGQPYGAVVAVASRRVAAAADTMTPATGRGRLSDTVMQFGGQQPRPQDLQLVEGIGPKIAALLIENNVNDLGQLAVTPVERLREILAGAGRRFRLADPGTWPRQAQLAAAGEWAALTQMQTALKAGREEG